MRTIHSANELRAGGRKVCLAIGFFDGVHLGHQQIIRQTISDARQHEGLAVVLTFDRHPNVVVAPAKVPPLIYPLPRKLRAIEGLGVDNLLLLHFDREFSQQTGEDFVKRLVREIGPIQSLCVGSNFVFGHKRSGNVELLKRLGAELRFVVHGMAAVSLDGKAVSSTRIREAIARGDLDGAGQMLGRTYSLSGKVIPGDGVGRKLGFPTANLEVAGLALPPGGVYAIHAEVEGQAFRAVLNIGHRPTRNQPAPVLHVEAHLLDFTGDLYGKDLEVVFVDRLRDEKKFNSMDELRDQIGRDIEAARGRF
ncbi:MAG TPA: bifunctional riboflavin kinase/FAD synthetase [Methylomirabilota bacterium]|nr:bifunctional riboflavin kinase/FAD synthetase [Methylomirabilota bacterium]